MTTLILTPLVRVPDPSCQVCNVINGNFTPQDVAKYSGMWVHVHERGRMTVLHEQKKLGCLGDQRGYGMPLTGCL